MNEDKKEIYDDIATAYSGLKTKMDDIAITRRALWALLGDVAGQSVLDLACGSGYYTRQFKEAGASKVVGVDISAPMIETGRKIETERPLGITYHVGDVAEYECVEEYDLVTARYLLCYAPTKDILRRMVDTMYMSTVPGGRMVTITATLDDDVECK